MATATKRSAGKTAKREEGEVIDIEEAKSPMSMYIEHWMKHGEKKKGKQRESELNAVLEAAQSDLEPLEFAELEKLIAAERVTKRETPTRTRSAKGEGMSRAEWSMSKFEEAEIQGIWYPGHPDGCTTCGQTDKKHYSGGRCTKCYTIERNKRLIAEGKMEDPEEKKARKEALKAEKLAEIERKRKIAAEEKLRARQQAAAGKTEDDGEDRPPAE